MYGDWIIAGAIKIEKILTDDELDRILKKEGITPMPRFGGPIDLASYGF